MSKFLTENFTEDRQYTLKEELVKATTLSELADILHRELAFYADIKGNYINSLTPSQAKVALALLAILRESHDTLGDTTVAFRNSYPQNRSSFKRGSQLGTIQNTVVTTIGAGVGAFLGVIESPIAAIIGAAIGSSTAKLIYDLIQENSGSSEKTQQPSPISLELNTNAILLKIVSLFKRIDKLVLEQESIPEKNTPQLDEEYKDILEFLQELMGEAIAKESLLLLPRMQKIMKGRIPTILRHHNIEILIYQGNTKEFDNFDDYFEFEQSLEPDFHESITLKPAFIKNKSVVLKGLVREHNKSI